MIPITYVAAFILAFFWLISSFLAAKTAYEEDSGWFISILTAGLIVIWAWAIWLLFTEATRV